MMNILERVNPKIRGLFGNVFGDNSHFFFLRAVLKKCSQLFFRNKILLGTKICKTVFLVYPAWSCTLIYDAKVFKVFSIFFNYCLEHSTKNNRGHLEIVPKNHLFSEQILKKLFSVQIMPNVFFKLENCFLFLRTEKSFQKQLP